MTHMPAKCFVIAALLVAVWLGPARTANAQGATCTPTASEGCLKVTLTGDHKAGASVCVFNDEERKSDQQVGATQTTGADGTTRFKLPPGRYWGRAHKSGHGKSDPGGLQPVPTGGVQVSANVTVTPASFSLMNGYTATCPGASDSASGGGTTTGGSLRSPPWTISDPIRTGETSSLQSPPPSSLAAKRAEATRKSCELREHWLIYKHPLHQLPRRRESGDWHQPRAAAAGSTPLQLPQEPELPDGMAPRCQPPLRRQDRRADLRDDQDERRPRQRERLEAPCARRHADPVGVSEEYAGSIADQADA
jgi:hypothetical protein